ncbi:MULTISPECIES: hypothetical protein [Caballeronia]|uniref:Type IV pilus biogenesis protein PilP n=1 Tax=Caballeronia novacaledonica TaxID=1544861 RepID=A0AA37IJ13_9BURK|nr:MULTISPECIES: hypothetical protein [Caballeronia]GJH30557.1 hypothetical protein CBA19CS42_38595 [Caballeronia novacaledonica]
MFVAGAAASQESHLTLDDIDKLARAKLVDSMRGPQGGQSGQGGAAGPGNGVGLASPLGATPAAVTAAPPAAPKSEHKPSVPFKRVIPATFVGAYSDMSGSYVLYDYQGTTYTARRGSRLLNGWTVASIDGFTVSLVDGKRHWTETIAAPSDAPAAIPDSPAVRAITDLSSPLPPGGVSSTASTFVPFGK